MAAQSALSVLPSIYDSAVDSSVWGEALERSAIAVGAKGSLLLIIDQNKKNDLEINHFSKIWINMPEKMAMYNEKYAHYEKPAWNILYSMDKQTLMLDTEVWSDEPDLINRPDYLFLREQIGIVHKCAARLNDNNSWWDAITFHFDERLRQIPKQSLAGINLILPHVAKAVEISRSFELLKIQYNAVLAALDHVEIGMCITTAQGDAVVCNEEAGRILDENDGIRMMGDKRFQFQDPERQAEFDQAVFSASATARGEQTTHEFLFVGERRSNKDPLLIEVSPLRDYANELSGRLSGALITLIDPSNTRPFNAGRLIASYKLSKSEADVCQLLLEGNTTVNIAEIRSVSPETIKTQISSIFQKTRCARRSDLIRLVLKTTPPIS